MKSVLAGTSRWHVECSDCLDAIRSLPDACIDSVVTDPPAGIAFMNAEWDKDKGGRDEWIVWLASVFVELRRVVKPGAHALVWALPRTSHWTATAIEDAGWAIRDVGVHLFGSGFPKSMDISKAIDRAAGAERAVVGEKRTPDGKPYSARTPKSNGAYNDACAHTSLTGKTRHDPRITAPGSEMLAAWSGWGTALKPAAEHWILARAPMGEKTVAGNVMKYGTGAINVDATRIAHASPADREAHESMVAAIKARGGSMDGSWKNSSDLANANDVNTLGRWPANMTLAHLDGCKPAGSRLLRRAVKTPNLNSHSNIGFVSGARHNGNTSVAEVAEVAEVYECEDGCPVKLLDEQSGDRPGMSGGGAHRADYAGGLFGGIDSTATARGDSGGASRFFYCAKPCAAEKERGLDWMPSQRVNDGREAGGTGNDNPRLRGATERKNIHSTVKPVTLMRWLCKMITPPGGIVLDPFAGSGTTLVAALADGFRCIGIEQSERFATIARARVEGDMPLLNRAGGAK